MKLLIAVLFLFLMIPQTADAYDIQWGFKGTKKDEIGLISCSEPSKDSQLRENVSRRVEQVTSLYKEDVVSNLLETIFICNNLQRNNQTWYAGTYSNDSKSIYIEMDIKNPKEFDWIFHHEFSSLVFIDRFTEKYKRKWHENSSFKYFYSAEKLVGNWIADSSLQEKGALFNYSTTDMENDFNVMVAYYMTNRTKAALNKAAARYDRIRNKKDIVAEIYQSILK